MRINFMPADRTVKIFFLLAAFALFMAGQVSGQGQAPTGVVNQTQPGIVPTSIFNPESGLNITVNPLESDALQDLEQGKDDDARQSLQATIDRNKNGSDPELYYFLSAIDYKDENFKSALKNLQIVLNFQAKRQPPDLRQQIFLLKRLGDCYYEMRQMSKALGQYKAALLMDKTLSPTDPVLVDLLESTMGVLIYEKRYPEAEVYGKRLLQITGERSQSGLLRDISSYFWAQLELLDLYRKTGNDQERLALRPSTLNLLEQLLSMRSEAERQGQLPKLSVLRQEFVTNVVHESNPRTVAQYLWLSLEFRLRTLPLIEWAPVEGKPKAAILCIHGLGFENRAFTNFGRQMSGRGYLVLALDVRGFGSWINTRGREEVSFGTTLQDIGSLLNLIKEKNANLPIYLLGESMGGGIALRAGAMYGNELTGVIASVPSAERLQQRRMSFAVATSFLKNGANAPMEIGQMVTDKATSREEMQQAWDVDPKSKTKMSPVELIKFAIFMRATQRDCKNIKTTPVLIVQGLKDRLVKPQGTYDMFRRVRSTDKSIMIVGDAEHLIFETDNLSPIILDSLSSWLDNHLASSSAPTQPAPASK